MMAVIGVPQVVFSTSPQRNFGISSSFLGVEYSFLPGALLAINFASLSISTSKPAGIPSSVIPIAAE